VCYSPVLGHSIGLGFLFNGQDRIGEVLDAVSPVTNNTLAVEVVSPHFVDPTGERLRG
jgi:methylglutamate dehydrogenase subunit C